MPWVNTCPECGEVDCEEHALESAVMAGMRGTRQNHLSMFVALLRDHSTHPGFATHAHPLTLEFGFTCNCVPGLEHRVTFGELKQMLPQAREQALRYFSPDTITAYNHRGNKARKRKARRVEARSRALLFRYLTRAQKWDFRATNSFVVKAGDGHLYRLRPGTFSNVERLEDGKPRFSLCVHAQTNLPVYDHLLLQKIYLEQDHEAFISVANVKDLQTGAGFKGDRLLTGDIPSEKADLPRPQLRRPQDPSYSVRAALVSDPIYQAAVLQESEGQHAKPYRQEGEVVGIGVQELDLDTETLDNPGPWLQRIVEEVCGSTD